MMMDTDAGRVASQPGSRPTDQAPSGLGASRFDPSRAWRTDVLPFEQRPATQFVLLEGFQEHSGSTWHRLYAGTAMIDFGPGNRFGYRSSDIDRIQRDGDMVCVTQVKGWVPTNWPHWDWFLPSDSDTHPKGGDASGSGSAE